MEGSDVRIIDKICDYSEKAEIKPLLKEYLKRFVFAFCLSSFAHVVACCLTFLFRIIVAQPEDPIQFFIDSITNEPYQRKK